MLSLEEELIAMCRDEEFDLATAGFIASGIKEDDLASYLQNFEDFYFQFLLLLRLQI